MSETSKQSTQPPVCAPLCGAAKAYGRFDKPWYHEPECPVRLAWEAEKREASNQESERGGQSIHPEPAPDAGPSRSDD